ncbi:MULTISPECIES: hypothetical protein [unclassified Exiguobacterium]|uniref:hypothetical protein n=1 Tax=unclassified Exiguobacterium TaxID=2644629 RepID=UPI0007D86C2C|nr:MULTISPECIES: hypothetical protein [unclassified Exiguobacterium]OAI89707.1 hypothetical protein AYO36_06030 [Exiguobacterium sp. KKBO11]
MTYAKASLFFSLLGLLIDSMIFPPFNWSFGPNSMLTIPIGLVIYLFGIGLGIVAIKRREPGILKYVSLACSVPLSVLLLLFLGFIFSGQI